MIKTKPRKSAPKRPPKNPARDALILGMAAEYSSGEIVERMKAHGYEMGRSAVVSVIHRALGKSPRHPSEVRQDNVERAKKNYALSGLKRGPKPKQSQKVNITPSARTVAERAAGVAPPQPSTPQGIHKSAFEKAPPTAVPLAERTGCAWVWGGMNGEPYLYCNRPRCHTKLPGQPASRSAYCDTHADARRSTKVAKIIPAA